MYRYSYSPSTAVATTIRKESPTKGKSGAKKKISPKQKVSLKIFDFTSDDESDGASKKVKTGSKGVQKDNSRTEKKTTTKKTTKKATSGQLSDGNQVSDSEYSSQDSQTQSTAVETKTKSPKKTKTAGHKTAKKSAPQKTVGGETNGKSAPAASMKRKSTTVSEKGTPPKKPRVETPLTPPPGKTRVTRSGRLTRSTYRAAALWGEKMDTSESSQLHEAAAMDVEDPIQVMDAVPSVGDSKVEKKGSPEREVKEVGEGDVECKEGSPEKEVEKKSEVKGGEEDSAEKDVEEVGVRDVEEPCSQEVQVSDKDVASGFDVLDSDQPDKRSVACLHDDNEPEHGCVSLTTSRQADELVSDASLSDSGAKGSSDVTKSKCDDGESAVCSEQREKRSPTPEPPGPAASSSSKLNEEVSNLSLIPSPLSSFPLSTCGVLYSLRLCLYVCMYRVWYRGEAPGIPPPPPEILKLSMIITVLSQVFNNNLVPDCIRSNLRISKFKFFLEDMPPDPSSRRAHLCMRERAFTRHYHPTTILFPPPPPPNSKSCMKPWNSHLVSCPREKGSGYNTTSRPTQWCKPSGMWNDQSQHS